MCGKLGGTADTRLFVLNFQGRMAVFSSTEEFFMCAIYVLTGKSITPAEAELAFYRTASRGPDMSNFSETAEGYEIGRAHV